MLTQCLNKFGQMFEFVGPYRMRVTLADSSAAYCCLYSSFIVTQDLPKHHFKSCLFFLMRRYRTSIEGGECAGREENGRGVDRATDREASFFYWTLEEVNMSSERA